MFRPLSCRPRQAKAKMRIFASAIIALIVIGGLIIYFLPKAQNASHSNAGGPLAQSATISDAPAAGTPICNQPLLDSPYNYDGAAGTFSVSGSRSGLPLSVRRVPTSRRLRA